MPASLPDRTVHRLRRLRALTLVAFTIVFSLFLLGGFLRMQWLLPGGWFVRVEGGTLDIGYETDPRADPIRSLLVERSYYPSLGASAWRPFRVAGVYGAAIVIPLWQPVVLLAVLLAYSHGYVRGSRRGDRRSMGFEPARNAAAQRRYRRPDRATRRLIPTRVSSFPRVSNRI